jgi:hypothetical protein
MRKGERERCRSLWTFDWQVPPKAANRADGAGSPIGIPIDQVRVLFVLDYRALLTHIHSDACVAMPKRFL